MLQLYKNTFDTTHADTTHAGTTHADTAHADTTHADTTHADTTHADTTTHIHNQFFCVAEMKKLFQSFETISANYYNLFLFSYLFVFRFYFACLLFSVFFCFD